MKAGEIENEVGKSSLCENPYRTIAEILHAGEKTAEFYAEFTTMENVNAIYASGILCACCSESFKETLGVSCPLSGELRMLADVLLISTVHRLARQRRVLLELVRILLGLFANYLPATPENIKVLSEIKEVMGNIPDSLPETFEMPADGKAYQESAVNILHEAFRKTLGVAAAQEVEEMVSQVPEVFKEAIERILKESGE